jgi:filamentous hemagglutinin family protein
MTRTTIVITAALALAVTLPAVSAQAQSIRTFVSTAGSDSNPCSLAQPCRHFQAAVNVTAVGGEVDALDPGAYGSFTISQAITINGQGWAYVAPPAGGRAIFINAGASDKIDIRGVSLNGVGAANSNGIVFGAGGSLNIQDSVVRNFTLGGISFEPAASSQLAVSNTLVSDNGVNGVLVLTSSGGNANCTLDNVTMEGNASVGLDATSFGSGSVQVLVRNSTMANNGTGLLAQGANTTVWLTRSTITENGTDFSQAASAVFLSYADNNIVGNTVSSGAPATIGYK